MGLIRKGIYLFAFREDEGSYGLELHTGWAYPVLSTVRGPYPNDLPTHKAQRTELLSYKKSRTVFYSQVVINFTNDAQWRYKRF